MILASLIPAAINLIGGIWGKGQSDKTAEQIKNLQLGQSPEQAIAEALASQMAASDMPGFDYMKNQIDTIIPRNFAEAERSATNPSNIITSAAAGLTATNDAYNKLATENAKFHLETLQNKQNVFEHSSESNQLLKLQNQRMQLAGIEQEAQGNKDLIQSVFNSVGSGLNTYGTLETLKQQGEYLKNKSTFWGPTATTPSTPVAETPAVNPVNAPLLGTSVPAATNTPSTPLKLNDPDFWSKVNVDDMLNVFKFNKSGIGGNPIYGYDPVNKTYGGIDISKLYNF